MNTPEFSIVIPVFNSAPILEELCSEIDKSLSGTGYEMILVDDDSSDGSWDVITKLKEKYGNRFTGVRLGKNSGQHNALVCGFTFAKGNAVITMDDDMQHPPKEIPKLIEKFRSSDADVVYGIYQVKQHGALRKAGTDFAQISSKITVGNVGIGSSFRLIRKSIIDKIILQRYQAQMFIDEVLQWYTSKFDSVEVEHHERKKGKSGYTVFRLARIYLDTVVNYTAVPLKMMTWIGLFSSVVTFFLGLVFIYRKLVHDVRPGFTAEIVAILFSTSLLMFCMGIIGRYLHKIYHLMSRRPPYTIHSIV
ncbi:MAG TPA: glycosyltransferase [Bacteroidia bacterium]|jgi:glycosyltransferase involved in cell wall biosynthesis|nr:glycosyltransferase [Bacteroidia bacterium]